MDIDELARHAEQFFETFHRPGEPEDVRHWRFRDRRPTWLVALVRDRVHERGHFLPDDFKFTYAVNALELIGQGEDPDDPRLEPDVYTSELLAWLASHRERLGYVDEAVEEWGWDRERGIEGAIAAGQLREMEEVYRAVADGLRERLRDIEAGEREEFERRGGRGSEMRDWTP